MSYPETVRYLYALGNELKAGAKFGLERMEALLGALGNAQRGQRFVHVAGTNGKGSTSAMIASVLTHSGMRAGLYTSPHLIQPTERIQIDARPLSDSEFERVFEQVHRAAEELLQADRVDAHPSYFETVTAMAFLSFRQCADISVIEVGLGGRLDATNVIAPEVCVITPISFDHEAFLGNSLESIASEKAGIIKSGVPVVVASQCAAVGQVIDARAQELGCAVTRVDLSELRDVSVSAVRSEFVFQGQRYECNLAGRHQIANALTAILTCEQLRLPLGAIQAGLRSAKWPGRLEFVSREPDFVLDGAHNPAGAAALAQYIQEFCEDRPVWLVYGAMRDKAIEEITERLFPLAAKLILTAPDFPRAVRPEAIAEAVSASGAVLTQTVPEAIQLAGAAPKKAIVFFTGSLYLVGEARRLLMPSA